MRRKDKEIIDPGDIDAIIGDAAVCRLAMLDGDRPYVVPLCFGYQDRKLYFHSHAEGKKLRLIKAHRKVCFEFDTGAEVIKADQACKWTMRYKSVVGFGTAAFVDDIEAKRNALDIILRHYGGAGFGYPDAALSNIVIIAVDIESMTAKGAG